MYPMNTLLNKANSDWYEVKNKCTECPVFCLFSGFDSVYALVNNAAVFYQPFDRTEDDFDVTFQTNYLGKDTLCTYR